jgi:hypothetical protein
LGQARDILERIGTVKLVPHPVCQEVPSFGVTASPHPQEKANFRRKPQSFDKLGQKEGEALVVVGDRETLNHVVDGVTECHGQKGETLQEKVGLKGGVSGKELVPAISTEDGFDL